MNIAGARDYRGHGSAAQKSIWHFQMMLAQFHEVEAERKGFGKKDISEGEKSFYDFMKSLYQELYENPGKFLIPTNEYDNYIKSPDFVNKTFANAHQNDAKESMLRNTFQKAIHFYPDFFYRLGLSADKICPQTFSLAIKEAQYDEILLTLGKPYVHKENASRIAALLAMGINVTKKAGMYFIASSLYPKMFLGLMVLCDAPESKYKYMNYLRLDYKGYRRAMPEIADIMPTLGPEFRKHLDGLQVFFADTKLKFRVKPMRSIASSHGWKVEYALQGKNVYGFFGEPDHLTLYIYFNDAKNISEVAEKMASMDAGLYDWFCDKFPERLCKCRYNRMVVFGNSKRRICGMSNKAEIHDPNEEDINQSIKAIEIFRGLKVRKNDVKCK